VTDAAGRFRLKGLPEGQYIVRAYRRGGADAIVEHVLVGTSDLKLVLRRTGSVSGIVTLDGERASDDFTITATNPDIGFARRESFFRTDGAFRLTELPPGTFTLRAAAAEGEVTMQVVLAEGEHLTGIMLAPQARIRVKGRLIAHDDHGPAPELYVRASPVDALPDERAGNRVITDADGRFVIPDVPIGSIKLMASPVDFEGSEFETACVPLTVSGTAEIDVGELVVARRRIRLGERSGDLGFELLLSGSTGESPCLEVGSVRPNGPASTAGLRVGDVITAIDGTDTKHVTVVGAQWFLRVRPGTKVTFGLARRATVAITAADRDES
jgi:hypothetical protein